MVCRLRLGMLGLVLLASLQAGAGVAAASGWALQAEFAGYAQVPQVAIGASGEAVAVWEGAREDGFRVHGSWRAADGTWSQPAAFAADAFEPQAAFAPDGSALVIWSAHRGIEAVSRAPGGTWTKRELVARESIAEGPRLAIDASGTAFAVWRREPLSGPSTIELATRTPGGHWSAPMRLSRGAGEAASPQLAVAPAGEAVAVWRQKEGRRSVVRASVRLPGGKWSRPVDLSAAGQNAVAPRVAIDPAGEAVAIWHRFDGAHQILQGSSRRRGGGWSRPTDISRPGRDAEAPALTIDAGGEAVAVWERFDGHESLIEAATRPPGHPWSRPSVLSAKGHSSHDPSLATDAAGTSLAVWARSGGSGAVVESASRTAAGPWSTPAIVSPPRGAEQPDVAIGAAGEATVIWGGPALGIASLPAP